MGRRRGIIIIALHRVAGRVRETQAGMSQTDISSRGQSVPFVRVFPANFEFHQTSGGPRSLRFSIHSRPPRSDPVLRTLED